MKSLIIYYKIFYEKKSVFYEKKSQYIISEKNKGTN